MNVEAFLTSSSTWLIAAICGGLTSALKVALQGDTVRSDPWFRLLLFVLPGVFGAILGLVFFTGSVQSQLILGAAASGLSLIGHDGLKRVSEIPQVPPPVRNGLRMLLQLHEDAKKEAASDG